VSATTRQQDTKQVVFRVLLSLLSFDVFDVFCWTQTVLYLTFVYSFLPASPWWFARFFVSLPPDSVII
jgi:hypothetical protein